MAIGTPFRCRTRNGPCASWRSRAAEWNIDPVKVGAMGFSAGGHLVSTLETRFDAGDPQAGDPVERLGCRPDFAVLVYSLISSPGPNEEAGVRARQLLLGPEADPTVAGNLAITPGHAANTADLARAFRCGRSCCADRPQRDHARRAAEGGACRRRCMPIQRVVMASATRSPDPHNKRPPGWLDAVLVCSGRATYFRSMFCFPDSESAISRIISSSTPLMNRILFGIPAFCLTGLLAIGQAPSQVRRPPPAPRRLQPRQPPQPPSSHHFLVLAAKGQNGL